MKLYDISQEVFSCSIYPGDPQPEKHRIVFTATVASSIARKS